MLGPGDRAPTFLLEDIDSGERVANPWKEDGPTVLAFFKTTCPVCQMVAPKVDAMARSGARVVAIGEDPAAALAAYRTRHGQAVTTLTEPAPYRVSAAYGLVSVPTVVLVDGDGVVRDSVGAWDREGWNRLAVAAGGAPVSAPGDGLPPFRPG
jgi:peroxiredoxin